MAGPFMFRFLRTLIASDEAHGAVEYAVMLALIVVTCLSVVRAVGTNADEAFDAVRSALL
jgi:pilus assembly protein Flp/PilA